MGLSRNRPAYAMTGGGDPWYGLVDAARDPALIGLVRRCRLQQCLVAGDVAEELAAALPYLVRIDQDDALSRAWRTRGRDQSWGILMRSALPIDALRRHFKKFLQARLPDGMLVMFRFYDPRVFRTYLRTATAEERMPWFRGVSAYAVEMGEAGRFHNFHLREGALFDGEARCV